MLGTCRKVGRMFEVHDLKIPSQVVSATTTTATPSLDLCHARLGRPSLSHLQFLASQGHLGSISFKNLIVLLVIFGKQTKFPFNSSDSNLLLRLLILYIMIFGVLHLFPLRGDLDILSYLHMIFLDILRFICFTIGLNLCLFTKHFIK